VNAGAHVLLPAAAWGEKEGTVTNSERCISRQRAFLAPPGEVKPDWLIVSEVARRMGYAEAFAYRSAADIFREHAALSSFENDGTRDFDIGALAAITDTEYAALDPVRWPARAGAPSDLRFFADGAFFTPDRKARFVTPDPPALQEATSAQFPLRLNTGRIRDQWHSMTRSGRSPRLGAHLPEPFVEVHPRDAAVAGLVHGGFARVATAHGACVVKVAVTDDQRPGLLFVPIHWSGETASCARVGDLVAAHTDPYSGQPEAKATPASIAPAEFPLRGFGRVRRGMSPPPGTWWARLATAAGPEYRLATSDGPLIWHDVAHRLLGPDARLTERLEGGVYRVAAFVDGELEGLLCVGPADASLRWDEIEAPAEVMDGVGRRSWPARDLVETEPVICACFGVGRGAICAAIAGRAAVTIEDIGLTLGAGTNCGSCLPELKRLMHERHTHAD